MELIPILATIILVATISTFFLSIGAYILYKVREARGVRAKAAPPQTVQAELVTPEQVAEPTMARAPEMAQAQMPRSSQVFETPRVPNYRPTMATNYVRTTRPQAAPQPMNMEAPRPQPVMAPPPPPPPPVFSQTGPQQPRKFVKVTGESTEQTEQVKAPSQLKWR